MYRAEHKITNNDLLHHPKYDAVLNTLTCITQNRPLKDVDEASSVSESLSSILTFLKEASSSKESLPGTDGMLEVQRGQEQVLEIATVLSKRLEQYISLHGQEGGVR